MTNNNNQYFAIFHHKISERVIERAYESTPYPNADGLIDYLCEKMGKFDSFCSIHVKDFDEAVEYFSNNFPTIYSEDEIKIEMIPLKQFK